MAATPNQISEPRGTGRKRRHEPGAVVPIRRHKLAGGVAFATLILLAIITGSLSGLIFVYSVDLPQIDDLERYRPSTTTDLYDRNGHIIGSFALQRRVVITFDGFSPVLRKAVISIEDKSFESHWGVNVLRIAGAVIHDLRGHSHMQGASTLTMQLARNLFLSSERTAGRKLQEAYLAVQIERAFTKEQIFTLYGNQIYLGSGMYGFEAASGFFFSKHAKDLTLPEAALLAGLPKGPVSYSPIANPEKALRRRNLVISEMESDGVITHQQAQEARQAPLGLKLSQPDASIAPWFQEAVRRELEKRFGAEEVHEDGLRVETTLDQNLQQTANHAVLDGLAGYERRHEWRGKLENVLANGQSIETYRHPDWALMSGPGDYVHALVTRAAPLQILAKVGDSAVVLLPADWRWTGKRHGNSVVKPGDIIYVHLTDTVDGESRRATLEQDSGVQGALLAMDNTSGDVLAMVGGRDFSLSQYNRAVQAERQTGSSFKPYVYAAAIEAGAKPTDTIVDEPMDFGGYRPRNYEHDYKGAMTLTEAFAESRNIPAVKLADRVGIRSVIDMVHRFGITSEIPPYLPVSLGAAGITLEQQVDSYSVFPNDGIRVAPRLIRKVSNYDGVTLWQDRPEIKQVIRSKTAREMMTMFRAVIDEKHGTGAEVAELDHPLGGKTGTTSDYTDAWFIGFSPSVTCGVWMGFDSRESLGEKETGAHAALPIWIPFMRAAIAGKDDEEFIADQQEELMNRASAERAGKGKSAVKFEPPRGKALLPPQPAKPHTPVPGLASSMTVKSAALMQPSAGGSIASPAQHP